MGPASEPSLSRTLSRVLDARDAVGAPQSDPGRTPAAVLVALRERPTLAGEGMPGSPGEPLDALSVVLTQRRADLRRHAGEIAFPGGRRDPGDLTLEQTALREAGEEIGLPADRVSVLGALTVTHTFATNYAVHPFVGLLHPGAPADWPASSAEVESVLEVSLAELHASRAKHTLTRRGFTFETDVYAAGGHIVWGVTWRILADLIERLERVR